ncbi:hypothetical protein EIN_524680, partial [Entamoeba invadens IP1]
MNVRFSNNKWFWNNMDMGFIKAERGDDNYYYCVICEKWLTRGVKNNHKCHNSTVFVYNKEEVLEFINPSNKHPTLTINNKIIKRDDISQELLQKSDPIHRDRVNLSNLPTNNYLVNTDCLTNLNTSSHIENIPMLQITNTTLRPLTFPHTETLLSDNPTVSSFGITTSVSDIVPINLNYTTSAFKSSSTTFSIIPSVFSLPQNTHKNMNDTIQRNTQHEEICHQITSTREIHLQNQEHFSNAISLQTQNLLNDSSTVEHQNEMESEDLTCEVSELENFVEELFNFNDGVFALYTVTPFSDYDDEEISRQLIHFCKAPIGIDLIKFKGACDILFSDSSKDEKVTTQQQRKKVLTHKRKVVQNIINHLTTKYKFSDTCCSILKQSLVISSSQLTPEAVDIYKKLAVSFRSARRRLKSENSITSTQLINDVRNCVCFAIATDTYKKDGITFVAIFIRVCMKFDFYECPLLLSEYYGESDGESMCEWIFNALAFDINKEVLFPLRKFIGSTQDGASANMGCDNGMIKHMQMKLVPIKNPEGNIIERKFYGVHCPAHRCNLFAQDVGMEAPFDIVTTFIKWLCNSTKLKEYYTFCNSNNIKKCKLSTYSATRWNYMANSSSAILKSESLIEQFVQDEEQQADVFGEMVEKQIKEFDVEMQDYIEIFSLNNSYIHFSVCLFNDIYTLVNELCIESQTRLCILPDLIETTK